jgi:hypothetical protein
VGPARQRESERGRPAGLGGPVAGPRGLNGGLGRFGCFVWFFFQFLFSHFFSNFYSKSFQKFLNQLFKTTPQTETTKINATLSHIYLI